jgi:hypothetical protein
VVAGAAPGDEQHGGQNGRQDGSANGPADHGAELYPLPRPHGV